MLSDTSYVSAPQLDDHKRKLDRLYFKTYGKSLLIFALTFGIAEGIFRVGYRSPNFLRFSAFAAALVYLFAYGIYLSRLKQNVDADKKHDGVSSTKAALFMPVLLGVMIVPIYYSVGPKEVIAAMAATLFIFGASAIYSKATKRDISDYKDAACIGAISLLAVSALNVFIGSSVLGFLISAGFIAFHICTICKNAQKIKESAKYVSQENEGQLENLYSMQVASSLVSITLELIEMKKSLEK